MGNLELKTNTMNKNMKKVKKKIDDDKKISVALMISFIILTFQYFVLIYFELLGTVEATRIQLLSKVLVGAVFLYALPAVLKRSTWKLIITYFVAIFIFIINYLIFPENHEYLKGITLSFFFMCLPSFIYSMSIRDWKTLKQIMRKASFIVFILGTILGVLIFSGTVSAGEYSMSLSYYMLLPAIIYLDILFDKLSLKPLLFVLVSVFVILALGSRGAVLCVVVYIILKLLKSNHKQTYKRLYFYLSFFTLFIFTLIFRESILIYLDRILESLGIKSRSIRLFLKGDLNLSGRDDIYQNVLQETTNNPLLGIGIGGDRRVNGGGYVHNIFLEIIANFGIILGGALAIILLFMILKGLLLKDNEKYNIIIIWLNIAFVNLMLSSSYLIDMKFWILLGLLIQLFKSNKTVNCETDKNFSTL